MGKGYFTAIVTTALGAKPVEGAVVSLYDPDGTLLFELTSDNNGNTDTVEVTAPDKERTLDPNASGPYHTSLNVAVEAEGYSLVTVENAEIYDTETTQLPVTMHPIGEFDPVEIDDIIIDENDLHSGEKREQPGSEEEVPDIPMRGLRVLKDVIIPYEITVHLGTPASNAMNVTVPFVDYIKNVASHEIYPTWPDAAIEANVYCQITFALNRIYTEWYRGKSYNYDITNSTAYDQYYVKGGTIFANVARIVDRVYNTYIRRAGYKEPYFSQFCNGTTVTCNGLSQWGTVELANRKYSPLEILRYYYPDDVYLYTSTNFDYIYSSYPGYELKQGYSDSNVEKMQDYLNYISVNFPLIPQIKNPNGYFGTDTTEAVKVFQRTFGLPVDGIIGKATWNQIGQIYVGVRRLSELNGEGERIEIGAKPPASVIRQGSRGRDVVELQFILNYLSRYYASVPSVIENGVFDASTTDAVKSFQKLSGLSPDGIVGPATWDKLYEAYRTVNAPTAPDTTYPGTAIRPGASGGSVTYIQNILNRLSEKYPSIPKVTVDGKYGSATQRAVTAFQKLYSLTQDGIVGPATWNVLVGADSGDTPPRSEQIYPGYLLKNGVRGTPVAAIQQYLSLIASRENPSIGSLKADGIFGSGTEKAVREYQRLYGLKSDGIVGQATWDSIVKTYNRIAPTDTAVFAEYDEEESPPILEAPAPVRFRKRLL
ncbi:hypothetical protein FACS1894219_00560 [Clostridia bacterium]|nr:hypothetical protein FACS1894219_00560 [Clostridia bacterium]